MKLFKLAIPALLSVGLISTAFASHQFACPTVAAIQAVGVATTFGRNGMYTVSQFDSFGTTEMWGFGITNVPAASNANALAKANNALTNLTFVSGPIFSNDIDVTACYYSAGSFMAAALTVGP